MVRAQATDARSASAPLTRQLVAMIADRWSHGAGYAAIAEAAVDIVAEHVRQRGVAMDDRLAGAFAELMAQRLADDEDGDELLPHDVADYERARCCGASPAEALSLANRGGPFDPQLTLADALDTTDASPATSVAALRFADGSLAIRVLESVQQ